MGPPLCGYRDPGPREVRELAQTHVATKWSTLDLDLDPFTFEALPAPHAPCPWQPQLG